MYLEIKKVDNTLLQKSLTFFDESFIKVMKKKSSFKESIVARYLIKTSPWYNKNSFFSISHKENLVFIGIHNKKIWIDIEIIKKRDNSLLNTVSKNEFSLLWWKNWENFFYIWTAKESIIKLKWLILDDINSITIIKNKTIKKTLSKIEFNKEIELKYIGKKYKILSWRKGNIIYSITY